MTTAGEFSAAWIGPWEEGEFAAVRGDLDPSGGWPWWESVAAATEAATGAGWELALVAAPRPRFLQLDQLNLLLAGQPLLRVVVVAGSWCEGEWRTGRPPVGALRLAWYELPSWLRLGAHLRRRGVAPPWSAALTAPRAGEFVSVPPLSLTANATGGQRTLAVDCRDRETFQALSLALAPYGWHAVRSGAQKRAAEPAPIAAGVWDGAQLSGVEERRLRAFVRTVAPAPVVALLHYPRAEHVAALREAGAAALLGKPYQAALLAHELDALVRNLGLTTLPPARCE